MNRSTIWILLAQHALALPLVLLFLFRGRRGSPPIPGRYDISRATLLSIVALFLLIVVALSHWWGRGILWGDESAYRFQARAYAAGHIGAPAPEPTSPDAGLSARELHFTHHLIRDHRWFTKYPPLWPAVLAVGERLGAPFLVNPVLALMLAMVVLRMGREELALPAPRLAVAFLLTAPFYFLMAASQMSHILAALLVAMAAQQVLKGVRTDRIRNVALGALLCASCVFVRPFSAACVAVPLAGFVLHVWRKRVSRLAQLAAMGALLLALTVAAMAIYNRAVTGDWAVSPYALYRGTKAPVELSFSLSTVLSNLRGHARWSLESTVLFSFPFAYLLAAYGIWVDARNRTTNLFLAALPIALWGGHLFNTEGSSSRFGDRYVFESLFAVVLLASRGLTVLAERHGLSPRRLGIALGSLFAIQEAQALGLSLPVLREISPYVKMHDEISGKRLASDTLVFLTVTPAFTGDRFNLNEFDWPSSYLVLVDPGGGRREEVARSQGRTQWMVLTYDDYAGVPRLLASNRTEP